MKRLDKRTTVLIKLHSGKYTEYKYQVFVNPLQNTK